MRRLAALLLVLTCGCEVSGTLKSKPVASPSPSPRTLIESADALGVAIEHNLAAQKRGRVADDELKAALGASLYVCRAGEQWPGYTAWQKKHPGCNWDCIFGMLDAQMDKLEKEQRKR